MAKSLPSLDDLIAESSPKPNKNKFELWLESQGDEVSSLFWELMQKGYVEEGNAFAPTFKVFLKHFGNGHKFGNQIVKSLVDKKLRS